MTNDDSGREKNAVSLLNFGKKTAKRVAWEAWEFTVVGPNRVRVTNASYGYVKDDHSYTVAVGERAGTLVPTECECPADKWREDYDCKHKVALAAVGGAVVMKAAGDFGSQQAAGDSVCECDGRGLPCWQCYQMGRRKVSGTS
jgi:hypothetical protein